MKIRIREVRPGDLFAIDPIAFVGKPFHRENTEYVLYFITDVVHAGKNRFDGTYTLSSLLTSRGIVKIQDWDPSPHDTTFEATPLRFQMGGIGLSDPIPEYSD